MGKKLSNDQHRKFVLHYVVHFNGAAAARYAGYSEKTARSIAHELLTRPDIQAQISAERKRIGELHFDLSNRVVAKLAKMMEADPTAIFDADGNVLDPREWPEECKVLLKGVDVEERMVGEGDAQEMIRVKKVSLESPKGILDSLAKITGQFIERSQMIGKDGKPIDPPASMQAVVNITVGGKKIK